MEPRLYTGYQYAGAFSSHCATSCTQSSIRDVSSVSDEHGWVRQCLPDTFQTSINVVDGLHTATTEHKVHWTCVLTRRMERTAAAWRNGNVVGRINEVALRRARLVLRWVTVFGGQTISVFHQATQAYSAFYLSDTGNKYQPKCGDPLQLGSKAGMVHSTCG